MRNGTARELAEKVVPAALMDARPYIRQLGAIAIERGMIDGPELMAKIRLLALNDEDVIVRWQAAAALEFRCSKAAPK
jgi:hypothetical protein